MELKGEEVEISSIAPGTVVEVPIEMGNIGLPPLTKRVGIYKGSTRVDDSRIVPMVDYENGTSFPVNYYGPIKPSDKMKVLNGTTRDKVLTRIKNGIEKNTYVTGYRGPGSGCDPEIFVLDKDGVVLPAGKFLPGKKQSKLYTLSHWDGIQAEFCPAWRHCLQELHGNIYIGLREVLDAARRVDPKARFTIQNVVEVGKKDLETLPKEQVDFLCSPSFNAYRNDNKDEIPSDPRKFNLRFAGGHLHSGMNLMPVGDDVVRDIIQGLDGMLGVACVSLASGIDDPRRRAMYGRAGEYRVPSKGRFEYRTLSNFWLTHPAISHLVFELFRAAQQFAKMGYYKLCWKADQDEVRAVINSCDVKNARRILKKNLHLLYYLFYQRWGKVNTTGQATYAVMNGLESVIKNPGEIEGNWGLGGAWAGTYWANYASMQQVRVLDATGSVGK